MTRQELCCYSGLGFGSYCKYARTIFTIHSELINAFIACVFPESTVSRKHSVNPSIILHPHNSRKVSFAIYEYTQ